MVLGEDDIANVIIFNTARIIKYISLCGYLHIDREGSVYNSQKNKNRDQRLIYYIYILDCLNKVFISCLDRILRCNLISSSNKTIIKKMLKSAKFIKYSF